MATLTLVHPARSNPLADCIDHPSGYLCLSPRNHQFTLPGVPGFVAFREQGRHMICLGGVHAPAEFRPSLLDALLKSARAQRRGVVVVQVPQDQVPLFRAHGFAVNSMGASFAVELAKFSLAGSKKMKLRNKIKRAREQGARVVETGREIPRDEAVFAELRRVSDGWLAGKKKKELDFMIGELGGPADTERRIFAVKDADDRICAFISYVPVYGHQPGYLHDLTRKMPGAPVGVMELCNAEAIERFRRERVAYLHFGFTPFVSATNTLGDDSRLVAWVIRMLERHGEPIYPTRSQADYKLKWGPTSVEPEYVAFSPLSARAVIDLMVLTRSI
jgi:lysylphosphatidylglycerol synthetase-like protein (DUF2156 family)